MSAGLRWKLLLGCLLLVAIELPDDAVLVARDLQGPYCSSSDVVEGTSVSAPRGEWQTAGNAIDSTSADTEASFDDTDGDTSGSDRADDGR
jgi:hypothetical protein